MKTEKPKIKIWLDDWRPCPHDGKEWVWVKTIAEAKKLFKTKTVVYIDFDHDLEDWDTGHDLALWIKLQVFDHGLDAPLFSVHSINPGGGANIIRTMRSTQEWWLQKNGRGHEMANTIPEAGKLKLFTDWT